MNKNEPIIAMASIRKVYDTGKVKVEALKGPNLYTISATVPLVAP